MNFYEEEEDELQMMLEGREVGDDQIAFNTLSEKKRKKNIKSKLTNSSNLRKSAISESEDEEDEEEDEEREIDLDEQFEDEEDEEKDVAVNSNKQFENADYDEFAEDNQEPLGMDEAIEAPDKTKKKKEKDPLKKRIVQNPRVILDIDKLKSIEGLVALQPLFKKLQFKGKGNERDDLNLVMSIYERWAHRLMPSLSFDDFIEKTEILTRKAQMKTFLSKIRNDMPLDIRGPNAGLIKENDESNDVLSDMEEPFEPIAYLPEKEFSFSSDDEQLFNTIGGFDSMSQMQLNGDPVRSPEKEQLKEQSEINEKEIPPNESAKIKRKLLILENDNEKINELDELNQDSSKDYEIVQQKRRRILSDDEDEDQSDVLEKPILKTRKNAVVDDDEESNESFPKGSQAETNEVNEDEFLNLLNC